MFVNYAHRGASAYYPQNTMSAFYAGLGMNANGIETDVRKTKDGVLVLFHDDMLEKTTDHSGRICGYTYEELLAVNVYNADRTKIDKIPALDDFLRYFSFRDLTFAIELSQRIKSEPVYFALRHSSAASSSLGIRQYAAFGFLAAKHRKTK